MIVDEFTVIFFFKFGFEIEVTMKRNIVKHSTNKKVLEDESQKLKQKLETLKKQISAKKMEKEALKKTPLSSGKIREEIESSAKSTGRTKQPEVSSFMDSLEPISSKLTARGILTMEQLANLKEEEVDNWKDIGIGYRIKIKNYIKQEDKLPSISRVPSSKKIIRLNSPEKSQSCKRDIQDIIKHRKQEKVFVPIQGRHQEEQQQLHIGQQQQEVMIKSLMDFFKGRQSKIMGQEQLYKEVEDESQDTIEEIQYVEPVKSVKYLQYQHQSYLQDRKIPNYKYCWFCLCKVDQPEYFNDNRQFCTLKCQQSYQECSHISQSNPLYSQVAHVEDTFNNYLKQRQDQKKKKEAPKKRVIRRQPKHEQEEEQIDLQIE